MTRISEFIRRHIWIILPTFIFLFSAGLYLSIASTRLTNANYGSDGGDFLAAVLTLGIPHPTGYPTYVLLGALFQLLPVSTPVFRAVLESLLPAALAAGLLTGWMGFVLGPSTPYSLVAAALAGITWGVAPLVFSQAVIVEVHGLQALIVVLVLWWVTLNLQDSPQNHAKWLLPLSFLFGIGFGNHLTLLLLIPAALIASVHLVYDSKGRRLFLAQLALVLVGLLVYLYLPLRARVYPPINWGNPQTWSGFAWEVGANPYRSFLLGASPSTFLERLRSTSSLFLDQFGPLGLLAGAIGVIQYSFRLKWLRWILVWVFIAYTAFATFYGSNDSASYLVPAVLVFATWIGLAVPALWSLSWRRFPLGVVLIALLTISILIRIPSTRSRLDPRLQDQPARYAERFLQQAPQGALVVTTTDQDSFPLWYYHFGLRQRPDLHIVVMPLTQFVWYQQTLVHTYPDLKFLPVLTQDTPTPTWGNGIAQLNSGLPLCTTRLAAESDTGIAYQCSNP